MLMNKQCGASEFLVKSHKGRNSFIYGYASVFNIIDSQNDVLVKGAFRQAKCSEVKLLWQHNIEKPIGVVQFLQEDTYGLKFEAEINVKTETGREAAELIKQKAVGGLSIGFSVNSSHYDANGVQIIDDVDLAEISVVTFPANKSAAIRRVKSKERDLFDQVRMPKYMPVDQDLEQLSALLAELSRN